MIQLLKHEDSNYKGQMHLVMGQRDAYSTCKTANHCSTSYYVVIMQFCSFKNLSEI